MVGSIALSLAFATALISLAAYARSIKSDDARVLTIARVSFHVMALSFLLASAALLYIIMTHQYQYTYVYEHSSDHLSRPLLLASFYAGQEGSFMLWTLMTTLIGVFVFGYSQRVNYEREAMTALMMVLSCLLLILIVKSPFRTIFQSYAAQSLPADFIPTNPRGLNPTLENIWITIHPPILFTGFAAMTVPFVFAVAGMMKRDYQRWITISLPWALFASMALGFGIMLGGWWAYETLGWGGFWAWDPVENSSLIPWLACVALVHTMLVQKRTGSDGSGGGVARVGGLVKTNFALAIISFGLILYSTFLTRSGVLGDTSVHSFVSPGGFVYAVLLAILLFFVGFGFTLLGTRWRELRRSPFNFPLTSRENALGLGSAVLLASATVVLIGTSWPLFLPLFGMPKVAVPTEFYNNLHLPIALVLTLVNAASMRLKWKATDGKDFLRGILPALIAAVVGTVGLVLLGIHDPIYIALGFGALLALIVNLQVGYRVLRGNPRFIGAYVSHAGVALLLLGVIFTARYSRTEHARLVEGVPQKVYDYTVTYTGPERIELEKTDREKFQHNIVMERDGSPTTVSPVTFMSDFNKRESAFMEPDIIYYPTRDIYVAPKSVEFEGGDPVAILSKGQSVKVPVDSSITVTFDKFDMSQAASSGRQLAVMEVAQGDSTWLLTAARVLPDGGMIPVTVPGTDVTISFADLQVDRENMSNSKAILLFKSPRVPPPPLKRVLAVDISVKPFISFVWVGVVVMVGGFFFSLLRRRRDVERMTVDVEEVETTPSVSKPIQQGALTSATPRVGRTEA